MRPIDVLRFAQIKKLKLLSFDSDGVSVVEGTKIVETEKELKIRAHVLSGPMLEKLRRLKKYFLLNFTSGRSLLHLGTIYEKILYPGVTLQGENGIFTLRDGEVIQHGAFSNKELAKIQAIKLALKELARDDKNILGFEPKQFLISLHCRKETPEVEKVLRRFDKDNQFYFYWNGEAYDIAPKRFNKGEALLWLVKKLGLREEEVMVVGNDPNDQSIFARFKLNVTTDQKAIKAAFTTSKNMPVAGEEVVDKLLSLVDKMQWRNRFHKE